MKRPMKKSVKIILCVLAAVLVIGGAVGGYVGYQHAYHPSKWMAEGDDALPKMEFEEALGQLPMLSNTWEEALPQTEIRNLIEAHFASPLPEGKTAKKAIVIGYDGCRVDTLRLLPTAKRSAINHLLDNGGQGVFGYCGGVKYPAQNVQATSTAPGWCSMLIGKWAGEIGVNKNGQPKPLEPKTLLLSLVEDGTVGKSAFYVSWAGHFSKKNATYINEKNYAEENGVNATFLRARSDEGTKSNVISDIRKQDCSDFIFLTLEYTDHQGHATGFGPQNVRYVSAFRDAEATGMDIIDTIEARATYGTEDWLILITTDHGGVGLSHGGASFEERMTFIISNKTILG
ncbi:MAG: alkaline phosphatase family protein [Clostridia bacterium]|nr:alkaline phosphatase family protein [Clostridia bacterium]